MDTCGGHKAVCVFLSGLAQMSTENPVMWGTRGEGARVGCQRVGVALLHP